MIKRFNLTICGLGLILVTSHFFPAGAQELILYVDTATKQVYTEPGKNRIKLGTFQQVKESPVQSQSKPDTESSQPVSNTTTGLAQGEAKFQENSGQSGAESDTRRKSEEIAAHSNEPSAEKPKEEKKWYDRIGIRGYTQFRYSSTVSGDKDAVSYWPDKSVGEDGSFLIRRARLVIFGDINDHLSLYIQPDFASTPSGSSTGHFAQLRDAYADIYFDKNKEFRVRVGQSKIPYSFENLQSSQNRLALDRNDAMNSCCRDERDIGAFFYWAPAHIRDRFKEVMAKNLKGSGDYGMFAFGIYNGQGANRLEGNNGVHMVTRFTYPHQFSNGQILEAGIQALRGRFVPSTGPAGGFTPVMDAPEKGFKDERVGVHAVLYPQPFGLQAEWNWGRGPQLNDGQTMLTESSLNGGYVLATYKIDGLRWGTLFPFVKWQHFKGGQKFERNAPRNHVNDLEFGLEWQVMKEIELTAVYHMMNRTNVASAPYERYKADVLRFQLQWNY